jgi:hypothetical protein
MTDHSRFDVRDTESTVSLAAVLIAVAIILGVISYTVSGLDVGAANSPALSSVPATTGQSQAR